MKHGLVATVCHGVLCGADGVFWAVLCDCLACLPAYLQVVGGCDNVVAIVPKGAKLDTVTESTDAVILRATDAAAALELRKRLSASANQMSAVAGLLDVGST